MATASAITTALPTVVGATGSLGRIVNWVNDALGDICSERDDWDFMRSSVLLGGGVSFQTIAGQASYPLDTTSIDALVVPSTAPALGGLWNDGGVLALAPGVDMLSLPTSAPALGGLWNNAGVLCFADGPAALSSPTGTVGVLADAFGKWDRETVRCYPTATGFSGETYIEEVPFDVWRDGYMLGAMRSVQTRPCVFAVGPDQSLCLGPPPNGLYTITADYFASATDMVADADVPVGLPAQFHLLIVYGAMAKAGQYEAAGELVQRAERESAPMLAQLLALRAPRVSFCGALA